MDLYVPCPDITSLCSATISRMLNSWQLFSQWALFIRNHTVIFFKVFWGAGAGLYLHWGPQFLGRGVDGEPWGQRVRGPPWGLRGPRALALGRRWRLLLPRALVGKRGLCSTCAPFSYNTNTQGETLGTTLKTWRQIFQFCHALTHFFPCKPGDSPVLLFKIT